MSNTNTYSKRFVRFRMPAPINRWSRFWRGCLAGKTITLLLAILFAAGLNNGRAQNTWTKKANFGGGTRGYAVAWTIGSKGYISTGDNFAGHDDCWEYDPATNGWTQKANYGGGLTSSGTGFSAAGRGYLLGGGHNDFWEFDPVANTWTQKTNFPGVARIWAVGFSINDKGYIGSGTIGPPWNGLPDFWEYTPATDTWTQKADVGGPPRLEATGFSIGDKGYIGTGGTSNGLLSDFWEYDPASDTWTQKADFGGGGLAYATGMSIGNKGYIGTGTVYGGGDFRKFFYEYDPATDIWIQKADFGGTGRYYAVSFSINSKGYLGTGYTSSSFVSDFWEYTPDTSSCAVPANLSSTNITSSSAELNWDAVTAQGYKVRYRITGSNQWTVKNAWGNSKNLNNLSPNTSYTWEVKTYCSISPGFSSDWSEKQHFTTGSLRISDESALQSSFQIYPNPTEDHATIQFILPQSSHVCIKVYDVSGKEIACPDLFVGEVLLDENVEQGDHSLLLNTNHFSKGVYMVRMISDFGIENQKLIVQ